MFTSFSELSCPKQQNDFGGTLSRGCRTVVYVVSGGVWAESDATSGTMWAYVGVPQPDVRVISSNVARR